MIDPSILMYLYIYLGLPDTFIPITLTLDRVFTASLNDPTSDGFQNLAKEITNSVSLKP